MYLRSIKGKRTFSYIHIYTFIYVRKGMGQIDERRLFDFNKIYKHFSFAFTYVLQLRRISRSVVRLDGSQGFLVKVSAFLSFFFFFYIKVYVRTRLFISILFEYVSAYDAIFSSLVYSRTRRSLTRVYA